MKFVRNQIFNSVAASVFFLLGVIFLSAVSTNAQLDPTFGTNGVTITDGSGEDTPIAAFTLPDEKILVVNKGENLGKFYYLLRYNSDGSPDTTYGTNGKIQLPIPFMGSDNHMLKAVRQADGKIVLVGLDNANGIVVRVNENGTLDTSFNGTGIHRPNIDLDRADFTTSATIQPDGKIVVVGYISSNMDSTQIYLLRYLSNGTLDPSFGNGGYIVHPYETFISIKSIHLQSNGKILTSPAGLFSGAIGGHIRRYNADGSIDNSFTLISSYATTLNVTTVQPDDKIITVEQPLKFEFLERQHTDALVSRYNADGTPDTNFGTNGKTSIDITNFFYDTPSGVKVLADGQILVGVVTDIPPNRGKTRGTMLSLARLSPSGVINGKFLETKAVFGDVFLLTTTAGKIVSVGRFQNPNQPPDVLLTRAVDVPLQTYRFQAVPFDFLNTDGIADVAIYRPDNLRWYINQDGGRSYLFGLPGDITVPSDYMGDFATDLAVFRPSTGQWFIKLIFWVGSGNYATIQWGDPGDIPVPADYDGDGKSDVAVFRPSNGTWFIRNSATNSNTNVRWGLNGDKPAPGDYDGDGLYDVAVFRPSDGNWYVLKSSGGYTILHFGLSGDIPVQEDYDGDGKFDIAVWRPSDRVWYRLNSSNGSFFAFQWGISTDTAIPADYDGDGKADIAVWRAAEGRWYVFRSSTNSMIVYNWGLNSDVPLPGKL
jgi:uncharacterized delta-60 repeat protein